jgi:hypothetical protein
LLGKRTMVSGRTFRMTSAAFGLVRSVHAQRSKRTRKLTFLAWRRDSDLIVSRSTPNLRLYCNYSKVSAWVQDDPNILIKFDYLHLIAVHSADPEDAW